MYRQQVSIVQQKRHERTSSESAIVIYSSQEHTLFRGLRLIPWSRAMSHFCRCPSMRVTGLGLAVGGGRSGVGRCAFVYQSGPSSVLLNQNICERSWT